MDKNKAKTGSEKGNNYNIFYTNIRSLSKHFNELQLQLDLIHREKNKTFDVIALSESWIGEDQLSYFEIKGYKSVILPRLDGRRSGGCSHIHKRNYNSQ